MPAPEFHALAASTRRVLLCLDVQVGVLSDPPLGVPSSHALRENIALVLARARAAQHPPLIIHVRNTGDFGELDEPHTPGWQLAHTPLPHEPVIDKRKNNAFAGTKLGELISPDAEVVIVGLQSDFSVRATCSAALGRGNEVLMIRGAHGTYDRLEVLYGGGVTGAAQIEAEIEGELEEAGVNLLDMNDLGAIFDDR
ncbi:Isochorismatase-like protein [Mycena alexandri]|uniref:Isochorismatase-like protein n=1 Tax=Mycena alexandri TaxID=1745969 RepID=A0AAD6WL16_9AGAR|nr:Isochorismatase-like protein [Mycena alexandri]KAJ7028270.1 Isochorismatase-like protein [Mycena alexandri]